MKETLLTDVPYRLVDKDTGDSTVDPEVVTAIEQEAEAASQGCKNILTSLKRENQQKRQIRIDLITKYSGITPKELNQLFVSATFIASAPEKLEANLAQALKKGTRGETSTPEVEDKIQKMMRITRIYATTLIAARQPKKN